jgi:hypothetical protein
MGQYRITWGRNITDRRNRAGLARNDGPDVTSTPYFNPESAS